MYPSRKPHPARNSYPARREFLSFAAAAALASSGVSARAETWPARPVRLVVGRPAGGGMDQVGHVLASRLSEIWTQDVVIDDKPGATGTLALNSAAHAAPDGYTMLLAVGPPVVNRFLFSQLSFDPIADLTPVSLIGTYPEIIVVANNSMLRNVTDVIAYAKRYPGKLTWATPGTGSIGHLTGELFKRMAGIEMTHMPYSGITEDFLNDLVGGRVNLMFNSAEKLLPPIRSHLVHGLAVTSSARISGAPELPTVVESGLPGYDVSSWYGLYLPAGTPADIVDRLNTDVVLMLRETAIKEKLESLGVLAAASSPQALAERNSAGGALWGPLITAANIKGEL